MKLLYFLLLLLTPTLTKAQVITTIAGIGSFGYNGDGGQASVALLNSPRGLAIDNLGNIYVVDQDNQRIRKVNRLGIISTFAGTGVNGYDGDNGLATLAKLFDPTGVAIDNSGNVYIADAGNFRIRKVNTAGIITTIAVTGVSGYGGDGGPATACNLNDANSVAIDGFDNIYITDANNNRIRKIDLLGIITTVAGNGYGVPDSGAYLGDGGQATSAELYYPSCVLVDNIGNMLIADTKNNCVRKVDTSGIISTIAGNNIAGYNGDFEVATSAQLNFPAGLALDNSGNIYIADYGNNRVRKVNASGIITTIVGNGIQGFAGDGGSATEAEIDNPWGIAVDTMANVYFSDLGNERIRKVNSVSTNVNTIPTFLKMVTIYPNPATNELTISGNYLITNISITNLLGQSMLTDNYNTGKVTLDVSDLPNGVYFIKVNGSEVRKFVKE